MSVDVKVIPDTSLKVNIFSNICPPLMTQVPPAWMDECMDGWMEKVEYLFRHLCRIDKCTINPKWKALL